MLADVEKQVIQSDKRIREISDHFNRMAAQLVTHQQDFDMLKKTFIGTSFGTSRIMSQFSLGQRIIQESRYQWGRKKVNPHFFEFFNFTLPMKAEVPFESAIPIHCEMRDDRNTLLIKFRAPKVSKKFKLMRAMRKIIYTCIVRY